MKQDWSEGDGPEAIFRERLRQRRLARKWTQQRVADEMTKRGHAWHQTTAAKVEKGQRPVTLSEAVALGRIFGGGLDEMTDAGDRTANTETIEELQQREEALLTHRANDLRVALGAAEARIDETKTAMEAAAAQHHRARAERNEIAHHLDDLLRLLDALHDRSRVPRQLTTRANLAAGSQLMADWDPGAMRT
ncbi:helix-turn-helix domain-containing protein [Micromonospora sp. NPDC050417]|uniref:helix-turn-helix domain-containing protein n=1 Tax=Micromonospora sp. NPDC050417 TaxID=3364280 RepID=UPI0037B8FE32